MSVIPEREMAEAPNWDDLYRRGTPAWETNRPAAELVSAVEAGRIHPCPILELGCGSGADAVYLAQQGFDVTAVDCAAIALERGLTSWPMASYIGLPSGHTGTSAPLGA